MNREAFGLTASFLHASTSSFVQFAARVAPEVLPTAAPGEVVVPHGTTIVAAAFSSGVVMAGDRRATWGNLIAQRDIEKVFGADEFSIIGVAGAAGFAIELVRLFQVELEHYEKIEGSPLSLDGKANRLAGMIRGSLAQAMQGFAAIPLLAGWDTERGCGRIFSYDVTGGRYEETGFYAVGSGAAFARGSMKKLHRADHDERGAAVVAIQALIDSADDDAATAGPDLLRRIYPVVLSVTADGVRRLDEGEIETVVTDVLAARRRRPDGPEAPLL